MNRALVAVALTLLVARVGPSFGQAAVVSFEIRSKNWIEIPGGPVTEISAAPGDVLELEFRIRDWGTLPPPNLLRGYQVATNFSEFVSGCSGNVLPIDFFVVTDPTHVCPEEPAPTGMINDWVYVDCWHPEFVFRGAASCDFNAPDTSNCSYRMTAARLNGGQLDPGTSRYLATVNIEVSDDASGTFTLTPNPDPVNGGLLINQFSEPLRPLVFEGCTISVEGGVLVLVETEPRTNSIDARQPHSPNDLTPQGISEITIHMHPALDCNGPIGFTPNDFSVTTYPSGGSVPQVTDVITIDDETVDVHLDSVIPAGKWTRLTHIPSGLSACVGSLPGDVNNDRTASPVDILKLIDSLNGNINPPYDIFQTDIDRSNAANPADILRVIDLLNGADTFEPWYGVMLPPSPCN